MGTGSLRMQPLDSAVSLVSSQDHPDASTAGCSGAETLASRKHVELPLDGKVSPSLFSRLCDNQPYKICSNKESLGAFPWSP